MVVQRQKRIDGFTLLEMLAAIAIFSVVSLSAWQIFQGVMTAHDVVITRNDRLQQLQYALLLMDQDLQQIADRGPRVGDEVNPSGLFSSDEMLDTDDEALALARYGWNNPHQLLPRSELQRVFYRLKDERLERQYHYVLDTEDIDVEPVTQSLLEGVSSLKFCFYYDKKWHDDLPDSSRLPEGLAVSFTMNGIGLIERKYLLPVSWQANDEAS